LLVEVEIILKFDYENMNTLIFRTLVNTQVKYNSDTFVDVDKVKNRLTSEDGNSNVS
jgi:hypothetical protein